MEGTVPEGMKTKRRKMDLLEGWGLGTSPLEEEEERPPPRSWRWEIDKKDLGVGVRRKGVQTRITTWAGMKGNIPEGRKTGKEQLTRKPPNRRVRGKLSKKEVKEMRGCHKDISGMMILPDNLRSQHI